MSKKDFGTVADWIKIAIALVGLLGALASYQFLPAQYNWVWPLLAVIGLVGIVLIVLRLPAARRRTGGKEPATQHAHSEGNGSVAIVGDVKDSPISTGDKKSKS